MNFYKHHLGDYDGATSHLSWDEDMAYTRLLRAYYRREAPLPADLAEVYRLVRATTEKQKNAVLSVLKEFFTRDDAGIHNKRADEEILAYQAQSATNRRIARQRFVNDSSTKGQPNQNQIPDKDKATPPDGGPVWRESLSVLLDGGVSEKSARAFLGMLCRDYDEREVVEAVKASIGKANLTAYIRGVLRSAPRKGQGAVLKVAMP